MVAAPASKEGKSEREAAGKLQSAHRGSILRIQNIGNESGAGSAIDAATWIIEVRMVEEIKGLRRGLEMQSLCNVECLGNSQISVNQARSKKCVSLDVSESSRVWPLVRARYLARVFERWHRVKVRNTVRNGIE